MMTFNTIFTHSFRTPGIFPARASSSTFPRAAFLRELWPLRRQETPDRSGSDLWPLHPHKCWPPHDQAQLSCVVLQVEPLFARQMMLLLQQGGINYMRSTYELSPLTPEQLYTHQDFPAINGHQTHGNFIQEWPCRSYKTFLDLTKF